MIDFMIPFPDGRSEPYYEQIYRYIREEIRAGRIAAGEKLPSTRLLAEKLGVSRSTTQLAYDQLVAEGYLESRPYRGYYAAEIEQMMDIPARGERSGSDPFRRPDGEGPGSGDGLQRAENSAGGTRPDPAAGPQEEQIDFSPFGIDLSHFPFSAWRKLSRDILREENRDLFASGDPQGERNLREAIRDYLMGSRGIDCSPDQIVVGAGTEYLLMLVTQLTGLRRVAMENPTYRRASRVIARLGHTVVPVEMDSHGMRDDLLEASGSDMAYIMPSHQFPTGTVMSAPRRQAVLRWASQMPGRYLIEDDYDSEFRYRGRPIPSMFGADRSGRVIYLGTFSKSVAPAIRVSYLVLPPELAVRYFAIRGEFSSTVSRVDQEILARFLSGGYFERHLNRMRRIYRAKHDRLLAELAPVRGQFAISGERAGLHILLESLSGRTEQEMIAGAAEAGVKIYGLSDYFLSPAVSRTVLLGYANLTEEEIGEGCRKLCGIWGEQEKGSR